MAAMHASLFAVVCLFAMMGQVASIARADVAPNLTTATEVGADSATPPSTVESSDAVHPLQLAQAPAQPSAATDSAPQSVGVISSLQGSATVTRKGTTAAVQVKGEIYKGDVLKTGPSTTLGIIFDDETTFSLTANASISVDDYLYEEGGSGNKANFKFVQGTIAFVANAVAHTGDMTLTTPSATMGIRGTTGLVTVGPGSATTGADAIKLYPDADGKVGRIEVRGRDGASLGVLTRAATGFSLQRGGRVVATPLQISPQQAALDQNLVRQVHAERQRGQAMVAARRAARPRGPQQQPRNGLRGEPRPGAPAAHPPGLQNPPAARKGPALRPPPKPKPEKRRR